MTAAAMYPTNLVIVQRIVTRRRARGWSQRTLAERSQVPLSRLAAYEQDTRELTVADLIRLAIALEYDPKHFLATGLLL